MPSDAVVARILRDLHDAGFTDLVPAHLAVLRYPGPENRRPSELAAEAGMTKQAVNYLLGQMERLGYLTRDDDPEDQRFKRIRLTDRGHAAARAIRASVAGIEAELEQQLGPADFAKLRELLVQLNASAFVLSLSGPASSPDGRGRAGGAAGQGGRRGPAAEEA
jgi:DNA-binding MarR family transcriptional regulator